MSKKLDVVYLGLDELVPYKDNPRDNDLAVEMVKESIEDFGFNVPILIDKNNIIIAGIQGIERGKSLI